jgi:hypothetical protein
MLTFGGYRRTAVEQREAHGRRVNHKVVQRLHQAWELPLIRGTKPPKPSGIRRAITAAGDRINLVAGRETIRPFEVAHTDFTELVYANGRRKAYLMPLVDHATKLVLGCGGTCRHRSGAAGLGASQAVAPGTWRAPAGFDRPP